MAQGKPFGGLAEHGVNCICFPGHMVCDHFSATAVEKGKMEELRIVQVPVQGQHQSCCAVVENCQRCIFFVPQPGVFTGAELAALETEAATDSSQKIALIRHLHVRIMICLAATPMFAGMLFEPCQFTLGNFMVHSRRRTAHVLEMLLSTDCVIIMLQPCYLVSMAWFCISSC